MNEHSINPGTGAEPSYRVAVAPAGLPANCRYHILGDGADEDLLAWILAFANPSAEFLGFTADPTATLAGDPATSVVVCSADWPARVGLLPPEVQTRMIVVPLPKSDRLGYWEFFATVRGIIDIENAASLASSDWAAFTRANHKRGAWKDVLGLRRWLWQRGLDLRSGGLAILPRLDGIGPFDRAMRLKGEYWGSHLELRENFENNLAEIDTVRRHLCNQASQDAYTKQFCQYPPLTWEHYLNRIANSVQYFEYCPVTPGDIILNCGIYNGWELPAYWALMRGKGHVHNIDPYGHDFLPGYIAAQLPHFAAITTESRVALSDRTGELTMRSFGDARESIGPMTTTPCITVDDYVAENGLERVDIIKTDLEGAEEAALGGMAATVDKFRPKLAISVYHAAHHFWELPLRIIDMCKDYDFYFNTYSWLHSESIFYAIPREKNSRIDPVRVAFRETNPGAAAALANPTHHQTNGNGKSV